MSNVFLQSTGFNKLTLAQIKSQLEISFQGIFGENVDLDPTGPIGQMIGILAQRESNMWDGAEEIYTARNPNEALGSSLDNISADTGIVRLPATETVVNNVLLYGTEGVNVPASSQISDPNNNLTFSLDADAEITQTKSRYIDLTPKAPSDGDVFTIIINGTTYSDTWHTGDGAILTFLEAMLSGFAGIIETTASDIILISEIDLNITWSDTFIDSSWASGGTFTCDTVGANVVPANSLTNIVTPISGWSSVTNNDEGITGNNIETDDAFRIRRANSLLNSSATDIKIQSALQNNVANVVSASVTSNRTMITDGDGRPAKSFEAVVLGGSDADVATAIFENMPSGIQPYGNSSYTVIDSQGNPQAIGFSRPVNEYIWVRVSRNYNLKQTYPIDGDLQIQAAIVAWALINIMPGDDIIDQQLSIPIYSVPGIKDIEIELAVTSIPLGSPSYSTGDISISVRDLALFDASRIIVQDL